MQLDDLIIGLLKVKREKKLTGNEQVVMCKDMDSTLEPTMGHHLTLVSAIGEFAFDDQEKVVWLIDTDRAEAYERREQILTGGKHAKAN